jgi:hypothetical protein
MTDEPAWLAEVLTDPAARAAFDRAEADQRFMREQPCSEGNCVEFIDTRTGENTGGWGPVGCPCEGNQP